MTGTCPNCGAPIGFGGAQSLAAVCSHCRAAVARAGLDLSLIGKVPDLVQTNSRLSLNAHGAIDGKAFTVIGHLQLSNGDAVWDEWYASFMDGSWGWLAEAQDRLLFTQEKHAPRLPSFDSLRAGQSLPLLAETLVAVDEVNEARFLTAEGELPFEPDLTDTYRFADCTDARGGFYTIDYGAARDAPALFAGRELTYAEADIRDVRRAPGFHPEGLALACPNCGASLSLKSASSESIACPSCHSLLDVSQHPARLLAKLQSRGKPGLPLGSKGTFSGGELEVIGWLRRTVVIDNVTYAWSEYLLHGAAGYRWLSESNGHWVFMEPVAAGKVDGVIGGKLAREGGRTYRHFQTAYAKYDQIQGEFYWRIEAGEQVETIDYVAPPYMLSCEHTATEVNWSHGQYLTPAQIWRAFKLPGAPKTVIGVGAAQPNPHHYGRSWRAAAAALIFVGVLSIVLDRKPRQTVLRLSVPVAADAGEAVTLSTPFELIGGPQAVEISAHAAVNQAWVGLDVALINDETGDSDAVGFELSHYHGYEGGESWSEGSSAGSAVIGSVPDGRYVLRVEPEWQRESGGVLPATATVTVDTRVFVVGPLVFTIFAICCWPLLQLLLYSSFERNRWAESDHPLGSG